MNGGVAVLDVGKTNAKLIAFAGDGTILDQSRHRNGSSPKTACACSTSRAYTPGSNWRSASFAAVTRSKG